MRKSSEELQPELSTDGIGAVRAGKDEFFDPVAEEEAALNRARADVYDREQADAEFADEDEGIEVLGEVPGEPEETPQQAAANPDDLESLQSMSPEERDALIARLSQTREGRTLLAEHALRHADYTRKTQEVAERQRQLDAREQELREFAERIERALAGRTGQPEGALEEPPPGLTLAELTEFYQRHKGRAPQWQEVFEYVRADAVRASEAKLREELGPLLERTQEQELQAMADRFERQFTALKQTYPLAQREGVLEAIVAELERTGSRVEDSVPLPDGTRVSAVEKAFLALYGPTLLRSQQAARAQQASAAATETILVPGVGSRDELEDELSAEDDGSIEAVARMQRKDKRLLRRVLEAMKPH